MRTQAHIEIDLILDGVAYGTRLWPMGAVPRVGDLVAIDHGERCVRVEHCVWAEHASGRPVVRLLCQVANVPPGWDR